MALAVSACYMGTGSSSDSNAANDPNDPSSSAATNPGLSPLRRLTNDEYDRTVADLLGDTTAPAQNFPGPTTTTAGYDTYASGLGVSSTHAEDYLDAAEALATQAVKDLPGLLGCDPASKGEQTCTQSFVTSFGERAFRRPLTDAEVTRFVGLEATERANHSYADSIRLVLEAFLMSPAFLYRVEIGQPGAPGSLVKLTSWEMASRLSYLLIGSMPDAELFRAAAADELTDPANIQAQARRLLADPRAQDAFDRFVDQWLELRNIQSMQKEASAFPGYDPSLAPLMKQEANLLVDSVVWSGDGDARKLFSTDYTFVNGPLAAYYGIPGVTGDAFTQVALDPTERKGVLTLPGVMAAHAKTTQTLPARRGKFILLKIFCLAVGDPPPNATAVAPHRDPSMTARQYFTLVEQQSACGGCHKVLDGIGFGLENYDAVGKWRTSDEGSPIDPTGQVMGTDVDGNYTGGVGLTDLVAKSPQVMSCMARQFFRFATGRPETDADTHSLAELGAAFTAHGFDARELIIASTQTDAFLYRTK